MSERVDNFTNYSNRIFSELNSSIINKLSACESREIETTVTNLMKIDDKFSDMETKLSLTINKMIISKISKEINNDLNNIK